MPEKKQDRSTGGPRRRGRRGGGRRGRRSQAARPSGPKTVPLSKRATAHFHPGDRQRGAEYYRAGRVQMDFDGTRIRARVEGHERQDYGVGLELSEVESNRVLHAFCQCQRFAGGKPCKHVWATLLALAEDAPDRQPPGKDRVALRKDRVAKWRDLAPAGQATGRDEAGRSNQARSGRVRAAHGRLGRGSQPAAAAWRKQIATLRDGAKLGPSVRRSRDSLDLRFLINATASRELGGLVIDIAGRQTGARGRSGKLKILAVDVETIDPLLQPPDAEESSVAVVTTLPGTMVARRGGRNQRVKAKPAQVRRFHLPKQLYGTLLPDLCARQLLGCWDGGNLGDPGPLAWDAENPWRLALHLETTELGARLRGRLERDEESAQLSVPKLVLPVEWEDAEGDLEETAERAALLVFSDTIGIVEMSSPRELAWIELLREAGEIAIPREDLAEAVTELLDLPAPPRIEVPEDLRLRSADAGMHPRLVLELEPGPEWMRRQFLADLFFRYGDLEINAGDGSPTIIDWKQKLYVQRDMDGEEDALARLVELGMQPVATNEGNYLGLEPENLPAVAEPLLADGWLVEARGTSLRPPSPPSLRVESGIDWFELRGQVEFDGDPVELKEILAAVSRGDRFVKLGDGSQGLLPSELIEACGSLSELAQDATGEGLRFHSSQALLFDGLLSAMPPPDVDRGFSELRAKLRDFESIKPKKEPRGFQGTLRGYQREGLGWLGFLREMGLGGVLADDMGLGKTVQVLALLRANRTPSTTTGLPFLVVAPRSLVYNWIDEAARFIPKLKVIEYGGPDREKLHGELGGYDLVVTTYGTARRDIGYLSTVEFDTVVLDEAQAIKNPTSQTAKACSLFNARHRLALTGTPIENHLGELGSIFEFLNPGLLGRMPRLDVLASGRNASREELETVAAGIRPFILRRTKAQVLPDLPPKTEQVLHCTLRPEQRELYDKVRASYQASLLKQVEAKGVAGSAIQVLEALLRLRQVACHPGLVDPEWGEAGSAKLEALFEHVTEILSEGHKVIVFSQFTKLLAYVRAELDAKGIEHAYLDGSTRDRGELVERFQTDPDCNLFLISLKAGGTGLNLTAAGYVFLLDPWWNPAVEAQAIDRAHRIGQTQPVFAYRMIARDTVEEKIVELQRSKRQLADTILEGGEGQSVGDLTADDLRLLLS